MDCLQNKGKASHHADNGSRRFPHNKSLLKATGQLQSQSKVACPIKNFHSDIPALTSSCSRQQETFRLTPTSTRLLLGMFENSQCLLTLRSTCILKLQFPNTYNMTCPVQKSSCANSAVYQNPYKMKLYCITNQHFVRPNGRATCKRIKMKVTALGVIFLYT